MTEPATEGRNLPTLTALRAVAALLVFGFHASRTVGLGPLTVFRDGYAGVAFFFVLSGFVLTWSFRPSSARAFYRRRFARVYPLHLVTALVVGVLVGFPDAGRTALNLLLLQAWAPRQDVAFSLNAPSWSLSCEAFFYAAFPFILAALVRQPSARRWQIAAGLWIACSVAVVALRAGGSDIAAFTLPPVRLGEFVLGIALACAVREGWRPPLRALPAVMVAVAAMVLVRVLPVPSPLGDVLLALPFLLLIASAAGDDLDGRPLLPWRWAVFAGEVSFAFYLVHERTLTEVSEHLTGAAALLAGLVISGALAIVAHLLVEKPVRGLLTRKRSATLARLGAASGPERPTAAPGSSCRCRRRP